MRGRFCYWRRRTRTPKPSRRSTRPPNGTCRRRSCAGAVRWRCSLSINCHRLDGNLTPWLPAYSSPSARSASLSSGLSIYEGRFSAAAAELDQAIRADRLAGQTYPERVRRYLLGRLALLRGNRSEALQHAREMTGGQDVRVEHSITRGTCRFSGRLWPPLKGHSNACGPSPPSVQTRLQRAARFNWKARSPRVAGKTPELPNSSRRPRGIPDIPCACGARAACRTQSRLAVCSRGVETGRGRARQHLRHGFPADVMLAHLQLARANAKLGEVREAGADYDRVLAAWRSGDDNSLRRRVLEESLQLSDRRTR